MYSDYRNGSNQVERERWKFFSLWLGKTQSLYMLYHALVYLMNDNSTLLFTTT